MIRYRTSIASLLLACSLSGCTVTSAPVRSTGSAAPVTVPASGAETPAVEPSRLRIGGEEEALTGFVLPVKETFEEENRGVSIDIVRSRSGHGLDDLLHGSVDAIVSVKPLAELMQRAAASQITVDPAELQSTTVGTSDTVVFLHEKNHVKRLSTKQLRAIFSGKLTNWKQLRGTNRGIVVVWNAAAAADNEQFAREVLGGAPLTAKLVTVDSFEAVRQKVMATPGAIGVAPAGYVVAGIKVPETPVITARVIVVTRGEPAPGVKKLTAILKDMEMLQ